MNILRLGEMDLLSYFKPNTVVGALIYLLIFIFLASVVTRLLRIAVHAAINHQTHIDRTTASFLAQFVSALVWIIALIFYAQLIPQLRALGNALLAGASIASVVIGLAAQSTLGNVVAGIAITIYKPFRLGDVMQVATPTGTEIGTVESISLGYTTLRSADARRIVLPNSIAASQVSLNLSQREALASVSTFSIELPRTANIAVVQNTIIDIAQQHGAKNPDCYFKRINQDTLTMELKIPVPPKTSTETFRSQLIHDLSERVAGLSVNSFTIQAV